MIHTPLTTDDGTDQRRPRARRRLARFLSIATGLWTLFLIAHVLLTGRWWLWMLVEPIPPLLLLVVPVVLLSIVLVARPLSRWTTAALAGLTLLSLPLVGVNPGALADGTPPRPGAPVLKIFSWNTGYWDSGTGYLAEGGNVDGPDVFYDFLEQQNADVYLLSEHLYWNDGPIALDDEPTLRARFPGYQVNVEGELVTLSRMPIVGRFPRQEGPEPESWYWHGNKAQRTDVRLGQCVFSLYNVHLPQPVDPRLNAFSSDFYNFAHGQYDRVQTELAALRADLAGNPNPLLVAGDFNSPWMGSLVSLGDGVEHRDPTEGSVLPLSFPANDSGWGLPRLWRLDWVLTRGGVDIARYAFLPNPGLSDHKAQHLTVSLPCGADR